MLRVRTLRVGGASAMAAWGSIAVAAVSAAGQEEPFLLDGIVVTAVPTPRALTTLATFATLLDGDEMRAAGLTRVADALRAVPGLAVVQGGATGAATSVFFRGSESDHALVLVDGVQVNQPGGSFDFSGLLLDDVERIEVVRGGGSALYGSDAMAGVIHVITRSGGERFRAGAEIRSGSLGRRDQSVYASGGAAGAGYSVVLARSAGDGVLAFNNGHENMTLSGTVRFAADARTRGKLSVRVGDRRYQFPTDGAGKVVDRNAFTHANEVTLGLSLARGIGERFDVELLLARHESDGGTEDAPDGPADTLGFFGFTSRDRVVRSSADVRAHVRLPAVAAMLGAELEHQEQRSSTESLSQWGPGSGSSEFARGNRAVYVHAVTEGSRWTANIGGRVEDNERFGRGVTWQLGAVWRPSDRLAARASASRALKEPTFLESFATGFAVGNPDLLPERASSWEVGLDVALPAGLGRLRGAWFHQRFGDLVQYTFTPPAPNGPNYYNVAEARARGVDASLEVGAGPWRAHAGWSWVRTRVLDPGLEQGPDGAFAPGEPLLRRPTHTLTVDVAFAPTPRLDLWAGARMVGERADRDFSAFPARRVTLDRHVLVTAGTRMRLLEEGPGRTGVTLSVRGDNLFDRAYEEVFGFPAAGRTLLVGLGVQFGG